MSDGYGLTSVSDDLCDRPDDLCRELAVVQSDLPLLPVRPSLDPDLGPLPDPQHQLVARDGRREQPVSPSALCVVVLGRPAVVDLERGGVCRCEDCVDVCLSS